MPKKCGLCTSSIDRNVSNSVSCSKCKLIFHRNCADIDDDASPSEINKWICFECNGLELESMIKKFSELQIEINSIKKLQEQSSSSIKNFEVKLGVVADLTQKVALNTSAVAKIKSRMNSIETKQTKLENYERQRHLVFTGIPVKNDENLENILLSIIVGLGVTISPDQIDRCFRFKSKTGPTKPVLLILNSGKICSNILQLFRSRKKNISGIDFGLRFEASVSIVIGEHLSSDQQALLKLAKEELKDSKLYRFVWFQNGNVLVRATEGNKVIKISCSDDITKIKRNSSG